jgi:hypothetical protein
MPLRFEFDSVNKILLLRFEGRLTEAAFAEGYRSIRKYSTSTDAHAGIWDLSSVTEFALSPEFISQVASVGPAMPNPTRRPRFLVAPPMLGLSVSRVVEIMEGYENPLFKIVLSVNEAFVALGVQSPQFEPLA